MGIEYVNESWGLPDPDELPPTQNAWSPDYGLDDAVPGFSASYICDPNFPDCEAQMDLPT